ncbi:TPA: hypothetical protein DEG21_01115 [Patescibacteria group bacterium]|nr:hypothetical protein [Candidatus Gracilibacteria bacterium]HBY74504.1 hypothetical protein [Candidatus Gracilibacteria bacterium]
MSFGSRPFVSILTRNHISLIFFTNSYKSFWSVGSHPEITTPSRNSFLCSKKFKKAFSVIKSFRNFFAFSGNTNSKL